MPKRAKNPDAETAREILLWARKERIALAQIAVRDVVLTVNADYGIPRDIVAVPEDRRRGIIEEYGAALLTPTEAPTEETIEPTIEDDE